MEQSCNQSITKPHSLVRHSAYPESIGTNDYQRIPDIHRNLEETALWEELESKKHSVEHHLSQYHKYWDRCQDVNGDSAMLDYSQGLARRDEELSNYNDNKDRWRLKVEHDKVIRDLLAIQGILNMLVADVERLTASRCMKELLAYSAVLPGAYFVGHAHFNAASTTIAAATAIFAGYGLVSSLNRGIYVCLRMLVIDKCRRIVSSLQNCVRAGTVHQKDRELFKSIWFTTLNWFKIEDWPEREGVRGCSPPDRPSIVSSITSRNYSAEGPLTHRPEEV
ncbi:hypothetical protein ACQKWADRAFT_299086 [Trichoderma austrokoningii]